MRAHYHPESRHTMVRHANTLPGLRLARRADCVSASGPGCRQSRDAARPPARNSRNNSVLASASPVRAGWCFAERFPPRWTTLFRITGCFNGPPILLCWSVAPLGTATEYETYGEMSPDPSPILGGGQVLHSPS